MVPGSAVDGHMNSPSSGAGLQERALIVPAGDKRFEVTRSGRDWFESVGIELGSLKPGARGIARQCLDWTEREHHLGGPLGVALLTTFCDRDWLRRSRETRALEITPAGRRAFDSLLDTHLAAA